jgi:hypothetical protein
MTMFDVPKNYDDATEWFRYFRMTKHLPGMQMKFDAEMKRAETPEAAHRVMTSYVSAALDVVLFHGLSDNRTLAQELEQTCGLRPAQLLLLSVHDIVQPMRVTTRELALRLAIGGFHISADGIITGFDRPTADSPHHVMISPKPAP